MSKRKNEAAGEQSIEELQERYKKLNTRKIQADTNLEHATHRLTELKDEARAKFGTDDVEELRKKLEEMKIQNEEKRKSYQAELDRIEGALAEVEAKFAPTETAEEEGEDKR
jgi:hypothetical protein